MIYLNLAQFVQLDENVIFSLMFICECQLHRCLFKMFIINQLNIYSEPSKSIFTKNKPVNIAKNQYVRRNGEEITASM